MVSSGEDDFDAYRKQVRASRTGVDFIREVKSADKFLTLDRSAIDVLDPDDYEHDQEVTEEVPTGPEAEDDGYWCYRLRSDLPDKFLHGATVHVSMI